MYMARDSIGRRRRASRSHSARWARCWLAVILTVAPAALVPPAAAQSAAGPRPLAEAERQAVSLAMIYFEEGAEGWWQRLSADAPLRAFGRDAGLAEIAVRAGPRAGATWELQTPSERYAENTAVFSIEFPSGLEETLWLELVDESGWKIRELRCLADPASLREGQSDFLTLMDELKTTGGAGGAGLPPWALLALLVSGSAILASRLFPGEQHRLAPWRGALAGAGLLAVAGILACAEKVPEVEELEVVPPYQLASLLPLREALTGVGDEDHAPLFRAVAKEGKAFDVARLWEAQILLGQSQLNPVEKILNELPQPAVEPLNGLLRARLAALRAEVDEVTRGYDRLLAEGADYDGLRQEAAEIFAYLGQGSKAEVTLARLGDRGTRRADVYYYLAQLMAQEHPEKAEKYFRFAWQLEPRERTAMFKDPLLASLCARPTLYEDFKLGSSAEPVVESTLARRPLEYPEVAALVLLGDQLTITQGDAEIVVPYGASLAPEETPAEDARTRTERDQLAALEQLEELTRKVQTVGVLAQPKVRLDVQTAAAALLLRERWGELLQLTDGILEQVDRVPPLLVKLRAYALVKADRTAAARELLVKLAESDIGNRRKDPGTFYQLAELLAEAGDYDRAIRAHQKADSQSPFRLSGNRIKQLEMEKELASSYLQYETRHFDLHYPASTDQRYARELGNVLEAERKRLRAWIPVRSSKKVEVHLFPLRQFITSFSSSVAVVGLFDGRVRVPFADLESLDPVIISILSHELAHAMIAEYTRDQAPKWFQEGLAQHIQMVQDFVNPIPDLHRASRVLAFPVIEMVLDGFGNAELVELAYSEASWVVHFVEARYGAAGIKRLLDAFKRGLPTDQAIRKAFGISAADFEQRAWAWCLKDAPPDWPTEVYRYDRDFAPLLERSASRSTVRYRAPEQDALKAPAAGAAAEKIRAKRMADWHRGYAVRVAPVKARLGEVIGVFRGSYQADTQALCSQLRDGTAVVLSDEAVLKSPDLQAAQYLTATYQGIYRLAVACLENRDAAARAELKKVERNLSAAAKSLSRYGLRP